MPSNSNCQLIPNRSKHKHSESKDSSSNSLDKINVKPLQKQEEYLREKLQHRSCTTINSLENKIRYIGMLKKLVAVRHGSKLIEDYGCNEKPLKPLGLILI